MSVFKRASKTQAKARVALIGPSGSGKTFTALRLARGFGGRVAVIDSERGSASKYADQFEFDVVNLETFAPDNYIEAIRAAEAEGFDVLVIDSLSHAWNGLGGALEMVDNAAARSKSANKFAAWRDVTPKHNAMVDAIIRSRCHIIATMRAKTEWVLEEDDRGKKVPRKVGLQPIQRDGLEYEFDVVGDMDDAKLAVSKTRMPALKGAVVREPGEELGKQIGAWLSDGAPAPSLSQSNGHGGGEVVTFGPAKGTLITKLTSSMLDDSIQLATEKLNGPEAKGAKWADALQMNLAALQAEQASRRVSEHPRDSTELAPGNP